MSVDLCMRINQQEIKWNVHKKALIISWYGLRFIINLTTVNGHHLTVKNLSETFY